MYDDIDFVKKPIKLISRKTKKLRTGLFLLSFLLVFAGIFYLYFMKIDSLLKEETLAHLQEMVTQGSNALEKEIKNGLSTVNSIAVSISSHVTMTGPEIWDLLEAQKKNFNFQRIGIVMPNGKAIMSDKTTLDLGDADFFKRGMKDEMLVSEMSIPEFGRTPSIVYSVPVMFEDEADAVLFAVNPQNVLTDNFKIEYFNGEGFSFIVDKYGEYRFYTDEERQARNLYNDLLRENSWDVAETVCASLCEGRENGLQTIMYGGRECFIFYLPLEGINNWFFMSIIPVAVLFNKAHVILIHTLVFSICFLLFYSAVFVIGFYLKDKTERLIFRLAFEDDLTGGRNRNKFLADVSDILKKTSCGQYAIISFDIEKFKTVNDLYGYSFGDQVLRNVSNVIKDRLFGSDEIFARLSGDFFVVFLPCYGKAEKVENYITAFIMTIQQSLSHIKIPGYPVVKLNIVAGICLFSERKADINDMINRANIAREAIKGNEGVPYRFFDNKIRSRFIKERKMENVMEKALDGGEFHILFQPKVSALESRICGAEALVRWIRPGEQCILPGEFIPLFETNGFIVQLDRYILREVCRKMREWINEGIPVVPVSVNMSRIELRQDDVVDFVVDIMDAYSLPHELLELELTESIAYENIELMHKIAGSFKEHGIRISIDDFGAGYSSLSLLGQLPIDVLKLDKSFLSSIGENVKSRSIVCAVLSLAKTLGMETVCEGVEDKTQLDFLRDNGCDLIQGFLFSRPQPDDEFVKMLKDSFIPVQQLS